MGKHVAETCVKLLIPAGAVVNAARVGILGFTFKENVPDLRNTRVIDVIRELQEYGVDVLVHDPLADAGKCAMNMASLSRRWMSSPIWTR